MTERWGAKRKKRVKRKRYSISIYGVSGFMAISPLSSPFDFLFLHDDGFFQ